MDVTWCSTFSATTCLVVLQCVTKDICAASGVQGCVAADLITPTASSCVVKNCAHPLRWEMVRPHFHVRLRGEMCLVHPLLFLAMPSRRSDVTWHFQVLDRRNGTMAGDVRRISVALSIRMKRERGPATRLAVQRAGAEGSAIGEE